VAGSGGLEDPEGSLHDFGADAVAGEDCDIQRSGLAHGKRVGNERERRAIKHGAREGARRLRERLTDFPDCGR
jgi:hypothetical protein